MGLIDSIFGRRRTTDARGVALYSGVVARARQPHWYLEGGVPDTIDGRFDTIAALLALVMLRLEGVPGGEPAGVALTEAFVDDLDPQLREIGIGDIVVGKHIGRMMGMLGGRLAAYRAGLEEGSIDRALVRNLYREQPPASAALAHVRDSLMAYRADLAAFSDERLLAGELPQ